jgi:hypothetical protein
MSSGVPPRAVVDEVLGRGMTREIWSGNYDKALPVSVQDFDVTAMLPAVFYMFRRGHRRGRGKFLSVFGGDGTVREQRRAATVDRVATQLAATRPFEGFQDETARAILGDLLLCFCLENSKRALGRTEQVQRVAPAHYMASWVDLPEHVSSLRFVPEMIVAMLADQQKGDFVQQNHDGSATDFAVGLGFQDNILLKAFHQGMRRLEARGQFSSLAADRFDEATPIGLDQLLMIRLAQQLREAPDKLRGGEGDQISNQRPIAERAARYFSEDIRRFVRAYARAIPRHALVELLESCVGVGLTTIVTSVIDLLFEWVETGEVRKQCAQQPTHLLVDCSNGVDRRLRGVAEQSMDDFMRRIERFPVVLMGLRLLDHGARYDPKLKKKLAEPGIAVRPYATAWLNLLGELLHQRREEAHAILNYLDRKAQELAELLKEDYPEAAAVLGNDVALPNPVWRMAESLTSLQGRKNTQANLITMVDSVLLIDRPNGLAIKRRVERKDAGGAGRKKREVRALTFTDPALEYLVHLHVLRRNKGGYRPLPFKEFLRILAERYGFCIDVAPPGMTISNDVLQANRAVLERRLRDLGLLVGVNDAEAMKHLRRRFEPPGPEEDGLD